MPGIVCLQGGGELTPACAEMDAALLERVRGPVAVVSLASPPGTAYARTNAQGVSHFRRLGAEALDVPDPRVVPLGPILQGVGLVVLPGGSPARLAAALRETGLGEAVARHVAGGGAVMGASAGAMLLGSWAVLPDDGFRVVPGLGLAEGVAVVPHWDGPRPDWLEALGREAPEAQVLGIPERSGVVLDAGRLTALGSSPTQLVREGREVGVGRTIGLR